MGAPYISDDCCKNLMRLKGHWHFMASIQHQHYRLSSHGIVLDLTYLQMMCCSNKSIAQTAKTNMIEKGQQSLKTVLINVKFGLLNYKPTLVLLQRTDNFMSLLTKKQPVSDPNLTRTIFTKFKYLPGFQICAC